MHLYYQKLRSWMKIALNAEVTDTPSLTSYIITRYYYVRFLLSLFFKFLFEEIYSYYHNYTSDHDSVYQKAYPKPEMNLSTHFYPPKIRLNLLTMKIKMSPVLQMAITNLAFFNFKID